MEIERVEPQKVCVRPKKYAREVYGILVGKDEHFYYWVDEENNRLHKFDKKDKRNFNLYNTHKGIIYMIKNDINDKLYIGQTSGTIEERYINHLTCARDIKNKKPLYEDMRSIGIEHFRIEKIADVVCYANFYLVDIENHFIRFFNTQVPNGYNIRCSNYGNKFDRIWKRIYSITLNKDCEYYDVIRKFVDEKFLLNKWDMYRNFDLSIIYEEEDLMNQNESITIEITRKRPQEEIKSAKMVCAYNSSKQDRQELENKLIQQFKIKLKNILDKEMEYSKLNNK